MHIYLNVICVICLHVHSLDSPLLRDLVAVCDDGGRFPSLSGVLQYFDSAFDKEHALRAGVIVPSPGLNENYDTALSDIRRAESRLTNYLAEQKRALGIKVGCVMCMAYGVKVCF